METIELTAVDTDAQAIIEHERDKKGTGTFIIVGTEKGTEKGTGTFIIVDSPCV